MWAFIKWALNLWRLIRGNPVVSQIINVGAEIMAALPEGFVAKCILLVKQAALKDDLPSSEKHKWVLEVLKHEYPDLATNVINAAIPVILQAVRRELV